MSEPWTNPDLRGTWEIVAPPGSQWVVADTCDPTAFDRLARVGKNERTRWRGFLPKSRYVVIPLGPETQLQLDALLSEIDVAADLIEHHVYHGERVVMCSYDNLSCCWLNKAMSCELLKDA